MQHCQQKFVEFTHSITSLAFTQQSTEERVERFRLLNARTRSSALVPHGVTRASFARARCVRRGFSLVIRALSCMHRSYHRTRRGVLLKMHDCKANSECFFGWKKETGEHKKMQKWDLFSEVMSRDVYTLFMFAEMRVQIWEWIGIL